LLLAFENVSYRYDGMEDWALSEVNLTVAEGEYLLIAGASGSGKSTFCRLATGLAPHFHGGDLKGRVLVDGLDTREVPVSRLFGQVGLVFQNTDAQLFNRTVEEELVFGLEGLGLEPAEIEKRLQWVSGLLKLGPLLERPPHQLSGGEKQRVVLGAILALRPRLLLLDEPFAHLDPEGSEGLRSLLKTLRGKGPAVVVVEHRLQDVVADVDRLVLFHQGRLTADGPPRQVLEQELTGYGLNLPALVGHLHVVDAVPALKCLLDTLAGQHVTEVTWLEELDAAASGHRVLVVAVAGKREGGVRQREDEAAVADLVAVQMQFAHRHAHDRTPGLAADEFHAHGVFGGRVNGEHGLADLARQVAGLLGRVRVAVRVHLHSPLNCAGRFSRKAITPSM